MNALAMLRQQILRPRALVPVALAIGGLVLALRSLLGTSVSAVWAELSDANPLLLAERLVDLVTLLGLLAAAALTVYSGRLPRQATDALIAGVVVSVAGMLGLLLLPRSRRLVERLVPARWRQTYDRFEHGALRSLGRVPLLIACSALGWLIEGATLFLLTAHGGGTEHRHALHASARVAAFSHAAVPLGQRGAARALDCCFTSS